MLFFSGTWINVCIFFILAALTGSPKTYNFLQSTFYEIQQNLLKIKYPWYISKDCHKKDEVCFDRSFSIVLPPTQLGPRFPKLVFKNQNKVWNLIKMRARVSLMNEKYTFSIRRSIKIQSAVYEKISTTASRTPKLTSFWGETYFRPNGYFQRYSICSRRRRVQLVGITQK